jgi:esterase/lipase
MRRVKKSAEEISVFACSIGAYFSLLAYNNMPLRQALFLSPIVDMERVIHNMMAWFQVSADKLKTEREIATPIGQPLYWDYYCYVKEHPVTAWNIPTAVLYGEKDDIVEFDTVEAFAKRFHADLKIMEQGEHYFHTNEQLAFFSQWCGSVLGKI